MPNLASSVAFVLAGIGVLAAVFGYPEGLIPAVLFGIGGFGIRRGRVWSAYGLGLLETVQLTVLSVGWVRETILSPEGRILAAGAALNVLLAILFFLAGRSLASSGATRGRASPWIGLAGLTAAGAVSLIFFQPFWDPSGSMASTVLAGDRVVVRRLPGAAVHRGDVVAFRYPPDRRQIFLKRVVGVPGDRIRLVQKTLYVNGSAVVEPYAIHATSYMDLYRDDFPKGAALRSGDVLAHDMLVNHMASGEIVVPEGNYFVLGDNRDNSLDSRYWGFVPQADIIGRPVLIYWSLEPPQSLTRPKPWEGTIRWNRLFKTIGPA